MRCEFSTSQFLFQCKSNKFLSMENVLVTLKTLSFLPESKNKSSHEDIHSSNHFNLVQERYFSLILFAQRVFQIDFSVFMKILPLILPTSLHTLHNTRLNFYISPSQIFSHKAKASNITPAYISFLLLFKRLTTKNLFCCKNSESSNFEVQTIFS